MKIAAPAKINLGLQILNRREDGYHSLITVMQQIGLKDIILLKKQPSGIKLRCYGLDIDKESNLAYQAALMLGEKANFSPGVSIALYKNIPPGAGLAGGSSDAAAVLKGLNCLWDLGWDYLALEKMAEDLGADVPYCVRGGTVLAEGVGEKLSSLPSLPFWGVVLAKPPDLAVETSLAYKNFSRKRAEKGEINFRTLIKALENQSKREIEGWLKEESINHLGDVVQEMYPEVRELKNEFEALGLVPLVSGSGPTVFSLVREMKEAWEAAAFLERKGYLAWASWTE